MSSTDAFRLTYSTMFDPPAALHERFDAALAEATRALGADHAMFIDGRERQAASRYEVRSPIDRDRLVAGDGGAWPGYQPFGGWKASGSTGKSIGSFRYLPLYLREQSQTIVD